MDTSNVQSYVTSTFQALTDALVPSTSLTSDLNVHEYVIDGLEQYITIQQQLYTISIPLAYPTARLLNIAATQLVNVGKIKEALSGDVAFARLSREDRVRTLAALEELKVDLYVLPSPYRNDGGMVKHVVDALNRFSLFGYYSEWSAYGSTRRLPPDERKLEFFPVGWEQVGYPGVSLGYRDFRGFLLKMPRNEGEA
ncbi:hypothetical protein EPH95_05820 [Salicibibacter halophilus]|uniref:Uncharacterized protein n=1 Tax=Salicibibacter halophilus TaxID=2502791 RepID=A0A514LGT8_9BACI|nr:hypothetical protein [Salicibibacter halophilus]QDI90755.1 hypothetical protein EPH95_05820 [Salicibibacter halophilus]